MKPSAGCRAIIKRFEGKSNKAYRVEYKTKDSKGNTKIVYDCKYYTIGYGHCGIDVKADDWWTDDKCEQVLQSDLEKFSESLNKILDDNHITLNQNQFDALVSFVYNIGIGNFQKSTMFKLLADGDFVGAAVQFGKWVYDGGVVRKGLVERRKQERNLFEL
jgi:lysozyme